MYYITVDGETILEMYDSERTAIPPGSIQITDDEAREIIESRRGHIDYKYVNGAVVVDQGSYDNFTLKLARSRMIKRIRAAFLTKASEINDELGSEKVIGLLQFLWSNNLLDKTNPGADAQKIMAMQQYAKTKITQVKQATLEQLQDYNPYTDTNWP